MRKEYFKYMTSGKMIKCQFTADKYMLIENMDESGIAKGVKQENLERWKLLSTWLSNGVAKREGKETEYAVEKESYIEELRCEFISPANVIRFITPDEEKFKVDDLKRVSVNGKAVRITYIDDYHFAFIERNKPFYGNRFHICEFAELCEQNHIEVKPII